MPRKTQSRRFAVASLVAALAAVAGGSAPVDFRLIPAGEFRPQDGRPLECGAWRMLDEDGHRIVAEMAAHTDPRVIDYEHATIKAKKTGGKAPAAGWYSSLEWRPGDGLYVIGADWTALAAQMIADKEYRFISPVFTYDPVTGRVQKLLCAALTNDPGIDGLTDLATLAALAADFFTDPPPEEKPMDELLEQLRWLLNLPVGATAEDVQAQLQKLIDQLKGSGTAAASFDLAATLEQNRSQIASLTAQVGTPDPSKFVPVATFTEVQSALAALTAQVNKDKVDALVNEGLASGKLLPASESWARDLGNNNVAALSAYLAVAPVVVTPNNTQTNGIPPKDVSGNGTQLTASQLAVCSATGVSPEDFLATLQAEAGQAAA